MSNAGWRVLLATFVMLTLNYASLLGAPLPGKGAPSLRPITFHEFWNTVRAGKEVKDRIVPAGYIQCVLQNAEILLKQSSHASLKLVSSHVTSGTIEPKGPTRDIHAYSQEIREHLSRQFKHGEKEAVYLGLPIEISNTDFRAKLYLNGVVVERRFTLDNVDFHESVYFQGAVFVEQLVLKQTRFHGVTDFSGAFLPVALSFKYCEFESQANFARLSIPKGSALYIGGGRISVPLDLSGSKIAGTVTLEGLEQTLEISQIVYLNGVNGEPDTPPAGALYLKDVVFHDNVYMDQSHWIRLNLAESEKGRHRPIRFIEFCDLRQGLFDTVNFSGAEFDRGGDFSDSVFRVAVSFERTVLRQAVRMSWEQLEGKLRVVPEEEETSKEKEKKLSRPSYEELERNFAGLGDIHSQNACNYEKRWIYDGVNIPWLISGYWVKPWVPLCWIVIAVPFIYYQNKRALAKQLFELRPAAASKAHLMSEPWSLTVQSTFRLLLPKEYSGTVEGQRLYFLEAAWMKLFLGIFFFTLKNTSPLLRELLPYLLPK